MDQYQRIGSIFRTPLTWRGWISLPYSPLLAWLVLSWQTQRRKPDRGWVRNSAVGLLKMAAFLGWEWLHNMAHAAAAQWTGKPMDRLDIVAGMPMCIYSPQNHHSASPRQHVYRALGGPLFNLAALMGTSMLRHISHPTSITHEVLDVAVGTNTLLSAISLLPIPGIDGGPILKWSLVNHGQTPGQADLIVRRVNLGLALPLGGLSVFFLHRGWRLSSGMAAMFSILSFVIGAGWLKGEV